MRSKVGIIVIHDAHFLRRRWVKKIVQHVSHQQEDIEVYICDAKSFKEIRRKVPRISKFNLYFLAVDLDNPKDIDWLKDLRKQDNLGTIVLFVNNLENVTKLFSYHVTVLSVCEKESSKSERIATIEEACNHLIKLMKRESAL